jgi:SAM-dependent methyltransferase
VSSSVSPTLRQRFVGSIYATHNRTKTIEKALGRVLAALPEGERGLNVGAGHTRLHPSLVNLDLAPGPNVDCCASAEAIPFDDGSFAVVVSQETLEHVRDPGRAVAEIYRVLKVNGTFYCQLPFIIGYHPGPTDFWRFTKEGIRELIERAGFVCREIGIAVGPATGFYRIVVEFFAVVASGIWERLYFPVKGTAALLFYPLKWLDPLLLRAAQADRVAGGYYVIAQKEP